MPTHRAVNAGVTGLSAYCASKFAVRGLVEALRLEVSFSTADTHVLLFASWCKIYAGLLPLLASLSLRLLTKGHVSQHFVL